MKKKRLYDDFKGKVITVHVNYKKNYRNFVTNEIRNSKKAERDKIVEKLIQIITLPNNGGKH